MTHGPSHSDTAAVDAAIGTRRSVRGFLPTPVPRAVVEDILRVASRSPSGTNTQPWRVTVLTGDAKAALSAKIRAVHDDPVALARHQEEYAYYPTEWTSPYIERRRKVGWDLYGLLGIDSGGAIGQSSRIHARDCSIDRAGAQWPQLSSASCSVRRCTATVLSTCRP
jgi:nitroreductase